MANLKKWLGNWWVISIAIAVVAALVLVFLLPLVLPVLRWPWRLTLLALVVAVWGGLAVLHVLKARKAAAAIAEALSQGSATGGEEKAVASRLAEALSQLKSASGGRRSYLYDRPWYVIVGPPGGGKTTALANSGLRFPFSDARMQGLGGTRNLDFCFTDEAVLVDTAGRYTTQDTGDARDREGWTTFLNVLRKNRPAQPINGVLVAFPIDLLLTADAATLDRHASTIRRRLVELRDGLEVSAPVYVMFTKSDLIAGFSEYFDDLDVDGRRAVLGATFDLAETAPGQLAAVREFDQLARSIANRSTTRLQEEVDARRRSLILGFPVQFAGLRARVARFLDGAFPANAAEGTAHLRGFYFTSGVQEGSPMDRVLGGLATLFDTPAAARSGGGRAYFLNRLMTEVIFGEAGMVQATPEALRRRSRILMAGMGAIAATVVLCLTAWTVSYSANRNFQIKLEAATRVAQARLDESGLSLTRMDETAPGFDAAVEPLNALCALPRGYCDEEKRGAPLAMRFGLFQSGLAKAARQAYLEGLRRTLLPQSLLRLEEFQRANASDGGAVYDALKSYLMLGGQHSVDPKVVRNWLVQDWQAASLAGSNFGEVRGRMVKHLDVLLADKDMSQVWAKGGAPLDAGVVKASRDAVEAMPAADRAYALLRSSEAARAGADWTPSRLLPGSFRAFANGPEVEALSVPYFFTPEGYVAAYLKGLPNVKAAMKADLWVLGSQANNPALMDQLHDLNAAVAQRYAAEYIQRWKAVAATPRPANYFSDDVAANALFGPPSALKLFLLEIHRNTNFQSLGAGRKAALDAAASRMGQVGGVLRSGVGGGGIDAGQQIQMAFQPMAAWVGDPKGRGAIDDFLDKLKAARQAKATIERSGGGMMGDQARQDAARAGAALATEAAPEDMRAFVTESAQQSDAAQTTAVTGALASDFDLLRQDCQRVVGQAYPFVRSQATDASLQDMQRLFGEGGAFRNFEGRLQGMMNTTGAVWRWEGPASASFDPTTPEQFQKAADIRGLLAGGLAFQVSVDSMGASVSKLELSISGSSQELSEDDGPRLFQWMPMAGSRAELRATVDGRSRVLAQAVGPWAMFRLFDRGRGESQVVRATFGEGASTATLRMEIQGAANPFSRTGPFSFRCPARL